MVHSVDAMTYLLWVWPAPMGLALMARQAVAALQCITPFFAWLHLSGTLLAHSIWAWSPV